MANDYERIYAVIKRIPKGRVATYGQIARLAGIPGQARRVGYALSVLSDDRRVPWHRVVNIKGGISSRSEPHFEEIQRALLIREGIVFGTNGQIPLSRFLWKTEAPTVLSGQREARIRKRSGRGGLWCTDDGAPGLRGRVWRQLLRSPREERRGQARYRGAARYGRRRK